MPICKLCNCDNEHYVRSNGRISAACKECIKAQTNARYHATKVLKPKPEPTPFKTCVKCNETMLAEGNFYPHKSGNYESSCKSCSKIKAIEYQKAHPDKKKLYDHNTLKRAMADPDKAAKIREQKSLAANARKDADPDIFHEKAKERSATYRKNHPNKSSENGKAYRTRHPERAREQQRISNARPARREALRQRSKLRHAFRRCRDYCEDGAIKIRYKDWLRVLDVFDNKCCYCDSPDDLEIEHLTPVSKGGGNELGNLAPACQKCNAAKKAKFLEAFCPERSMEIRRKALSV